MAKTQADLDKERRELAQKQRLALFLINLAIDRDKRTAFENDPDGEMAAARLTPASIRAIASGNQNTLTNQLMSLQSNVAGGMLDAAKGEASKKKAAKTAAKKKPSKPK